MSYQNSVQKPLTDSAVKFVDPSSFVSSEYQLKTR